MPSVKPHYVTSDNRSILLYTLYQVQWQMSSFQEFAFGMMSTWSSVRSSMNFAPKSNHVRKAQHTSSSRRWAFNASSCASSICSLQNSMPAKSGRCLVSTVQIAPALIVLSIMFLTARTLAGFLGNTKTSTGVGAPSVVNFPVEFPDKSKDTWALVISSRSTISRLTVLVDLVWQESKIFMLSLYWYPGKDDSVKPYSAGAQEILLR